jgi:threonine/homoserine/homoserine lactone efflux protein
LEPPLSAGVGVGFREGLALNLVNPAIISFYVAIVPTFIPAGAPWFYFALLAATHVGIALACHSMWATALHAVRRWFAAPGARRALTAATGVALLFLAARVLM